MRFGVNGEIDYFQGIENQTPSLILLCFIFNFILQNPAKKSLGLKESIRVRFRNGRNHSFEEARIENHAFEDIRDEDL